MRGKEERGWRWGETGGALGFGPGRGPTQCFPWIRTRKRPAFRPTKCVFFKKKVVVTLRLQEKTVFHTKISTSPPSSFPCGVIVLCALRCAFVFLCVRRADAVPMLCCAWRCGVLCCCCVRGVLCSAVFPSECHDFCFWVGTK